MNINSFDLNLLVAFEALMTEGQVTRAARRLHVTQPALSGALARLRTLFNDPLFVQDGKAMRPTLRARELEIPIRAALGQLRDALAHPTFHPQTSALTLRMAMSDDVELLLMPKVLNRIKAVAPGVTVVVRRVAGLFDLPAQELEAGTLDLAIGPFVRSTHSSAGLTVAPLYEDHFVCAVRRNHPTVKHSLSLARFLELQHVVVYYAAQGVGMIDQLLLEHGGKRKVAMEAPHYVTAMFAAGQTDFIVSAPARLARHLSAAAGLRLLEFPLPMRLSYGLHWHGRHGNDPAHRWLRQLVIDAGSAPVRG